MSGNIQSNSKKFKLRIVDVAIILEGILAGLIFFTHSMWLVLPLIIIAVYTYTQKSKTKEDKERRESISNQAFAFGLLIPAFIIMGLFILLIVKLVPVIIQNWR